MDAIPIVSIPDRDYRGFRLAIADGWVECSRGVSIPDRDYRGFRLVSLIELYDTSHVSIPDRDYRGFRPGSILWSIKNQPFQSLIGIIEDFDGGTQPRSRADKRFNP